MPKCPSMPLGLTSLILGTVLTANATGDTWGPIEKTEFASEHAKHLLKITPHDKWAWNPGLCRAELYRTENDKRTLVWSRYLINNEAPVRVYVSDAGRYVVTMDEWHEVGTLPIVIYGPTAALVHVHNLESLGLREDLFHIKITVSSTWWNENALVFFGPKEEMLIIRLHWGRILLIDLHTGRVPEEDDFKPDEWQALSGFIAEQSKRQVLSLLRSEDAKDRETGALHAGRLGIQEARPLLTQLAVNDDAYHVKVSGIAGLLSGGRKVYFVRDTARNALKALDRPASQPVRQADQEEIRTIRFRVSKAKMHLGHSIAEDNHHPDWVDGCVGRLVDGDDEFVLWWNNGEITNYAFRFEDSGTYEIHYVGEIEDGVMGFKGKCLSVRKVVKVERSGD